MSQKMEVLIVEDNDIMLTFLVNTLKAAGYGVRTASNGVEALRILEEGTCRLVVSDWVMPEMGGIELCKAIRSRDLSGYIYFILVTGRGGLQDTIKGLSSGADDFIAKPFNPAELQVRVRTGERILSLETHDVAMFAMARLAESRDPETGSHLDRVRCYVRVIAKGLIGRDQYEGIVDDQYVRLIYQTSPLHDIGKVGIPDMVLLKPGRLSDREFEVMKTHTTLGARTLAAAVERFPYAPFLRMAHDIAAYHHERFDGSGYPEGLAGEEIPLAARIMALADVYDALISKRVYKEAFSVDIAHSIILQESGSHFDPDLVEIFDRCYDQFSEIQEEYAPSAGAAQ